MENLLPYSYKSLEAGYWLLPAGVVHAGVGFLSFELKLPLQFFLINKSNRAFVRVW
jgi:hypothetical protein